eukprot:scaffold7386_cov509-Prasinococcus_capsulatus_cf.AAC.7
MSRKPKSQKLGSKRALSLTLKLVLGGIVMTLTTLGFLVTYRDGGNDRVDGLSIATLEHRERAARSHAFDQQAGLESGANSTVVLQGQVVVDGVAGDSSDTGSPSGEVVVTQQHRKSALSTPTARVPIKLNSRDPTEARGSAFMKSGEKAKQLLTKKLPFGKSPEEHPINLDVPEEHRPKTEQKRSELSSPVMKIADSAVTGWYLDPSKIEVLSTDKYVPTAAASAGPPLLRHQRTS